MPEISKTRVGQMVRGVFKLLLPHQDGLKVREVLTSLEQIVPPTPFEATEYPNRPGVRRFENIVRFATIGPVKAGWLIKEKGLWTLTEDGRQAYKKYGDPEQFSRESDRLYRKWASSQPKPEAEETIEDPGTAAATVEEAEERAWTEIETYLAYMNPYDFQELVAGLLRGMGYHVAWVSPPGADRGIDIIAHEDPLGINGPRVKVQVKRRPNDRTGVDGIRSFMATLADGDVGLFVASGGFSRDAEDEARRQERRRITLVDLKKLFDLWVEHYNEIPETNKRLLPLRSVYFLDLSE